MINDLDDRTMAKPAPAGVLLYFSATDLKKRGWTERLVHLFLSQPDRTEPNPHVKTGHPRRLYLSSRVIAIENTAEEFAEQRNRSLAYSARLKQQAGEKRVALEQLVRGIALPPMALPFEEVVRQAKAKQMEDVFLRASRFSGLRSMFSLIALNRWSGN
ncbi:MAG TPA: hypothetical protein VJ698_03660 [Noviherbaspirillum sp.]|uniref:hypothetical protein n=1 Tax=Noviherbaspirillum sp. TaxID=1926288 RepID=UPI002B487FAF|nr:hypothetical protein [Noviherbaspirillum sp.]HJV84547.1 hypothetical protein [Noviherbaspirillum sp.]